MVTPVRCWTCCCASSRRTNPTTKKYTVAPIAPWVCRSTPRRLMAAAVSSSWRREFGPSGGVPKATDASQGGRAKGTRCQPWGAKEHPAGAPREPGQVRPPVARRLQGVLAGDLVAHQLDELVLATHPPVERHGPGAGRVGDAAHGEGVQALVVGDGDRGPDDLLAIKAAGPPARWALGAGPYQAGAIAADGEEIRGV